MEVKLHPKLITAIERGELRRDWRDVARRIEAQEGQWQLVAVTQRNDRGVAKEVEDRLKRVGCIAQVIALKGMNIHQRPWSGWAVFARIPRSRRAPNDKLF
jgi:hypothetical protein